MPYLGNNIVGWMTPLELEWLFQNAKEMSTIIEVGSWKGRSTHALLTGCKDGTVTAVDHFMGSADVRDLTHAEGAGGKVFNEFLQNVGHFPNLIVKKMNSLQASKVCEPADMVFIDAEHTFEGVQKDISLWKPKAKKILCGHDYVNTWPEVVDAVNKSIGKPDGVVGSIWFKICE